jgi:hypothetical protein
MEAVFSLTDFRWKDGVFLSFRDDESSGGMILMEVCVLYGAVRSVLYLLKIRESFTQIMEANQNKKKPTNV